MFHSIEAMICWIVQLSPVAIVNLVAMTSVLFFDGLIIICMVRNSANPFVRDMT